MGNSNSLSHRHVLQEVHQVDHQLGQIGWPGTIVHGQLRWPVHGCEQSSAEAIGLSAQCLRAENTMAGHRDHFDGERQ